MMSAVPEPKTALTSMTKVSGFNSSSVRHMIQGPMRSEKVYHITDLIKQKSE